MATEVYIPKLGMTMTEGTVAEWHFTDGAEVSLGESVFRLETEKIEFEVEAEATGTLRLIAAEGDILDVGAVVAYILAPGEAMPAGVASSPSAPAAASNGAAAPAAAAATAATPAAQEGGRVAATPSARRLAGERGIDLATVAGTGPEGRITEDDILSYRPAAAAPAAAAASPASEVASASPVARKLAESLGVDLSTVKGSGPGGRITREDVEAAAAAPKAAPAPSAAPARAAAPAAPTQQPGQIIPVRGIRKIIFERMHQSMSEMAQLTLSMEAWMDEAVKLRGQLVEEWAADGVRPSYTDLVIKAVAKALRKHPNMNAEVRGMEIHLLNEVHVGMAVATDAGLVVPVIRNTDQLTLKEIAVESSRLAEGARTGKLGPDDYVGGTHSVSTLGFYGVDVFTPIINPPNVGLMGVGRLKDGVDWDGDRPVKRQQMTLSLTWDHRVNDGVPAAEFCATVKSFLEAPYRLLV